MKKQLAIALGLALALGLGTLIYPPAMLVIAVICGYTIVSVVQGLETTKAVIISGIPILGLLLTVFGQTKVSTHPSQNTELDPINWIRWVFDPMANSPFTDGHGNFETAALRVLLMILPYFIACIGSKMLFFSKDSDWD